MSFVARLYLIAFVLSAFYRAQAQEPLRFEVASVHVADAKPPQSPLLVTGQIIGGPGTADRLGSPIGGC